MSNIAIPFQHIDWDVVPKVEYPGESGMAVWQTIEIDGLRVRTVEYSAGYLADHWCQKGHIVHCLDGEFVTGHESGETLRLVKGMSYLVSDGMSSHRSKTSTGARLLIIDGDFLGPDQTELK